MQFRSCVWREMLLVMLEVVSLSKFILSPQKRYLSLSQLSSFYLIHFLCQSESLMKGYSERSVRSSMKMRL